MPSSRTVSSSSLLHVAGPQRVLGLERGDRMGRVRAANGLGRRLGQPEEAHLAGLHQLAHRPHRLLDRRLGVHAVLVEEVDVVEAEPPQRVVARFLHVLGPAVHAAVGGIAAADDPELGGEHDLVAPVGDRTAHQLLVGAAAVHRGGVEEAHPQLQRAMDSGDRLGVVALAVELGHPHAPQPLGGCGQSLCAERPLIDHAGRRYVVLGGHDLDGAEAVQRRVHEEDLHRDVRLHVGLAQEGEHVAAGQPLDGLLVAIGHHALEVLAHGHHAVGLAALHDRLFKRGEAAAPHHADDDVVQRIGLGLHRSAAVVVAQDPDDRRRDLGQQLASGKSLLHGPPCPPAPARRRRPWSRFRPDARDRESDLGRSCHLSEASTTGGTFNRPRAPPPDRAETPRRTRRRPWPCRSGT